MAEPISLEKPEFNLVASTEETETSASATETTPDTPFRAALLGDFAGRASRAAAPPQSGRRLFEIDRDNFDAVLGQLGVELSLSLPGAAAPVALRFRELEDFHPDRIYQRLDIFRSLRETRRRLDDPSTFDDAAAEVRGWADDTAGSPRDERAEASDPRPAPDTPGRDLLEQMLGREVSADAPSVRSSDRPAELTDFGRFLGDIVRPHLSSVDERQKADLTEAVDEAAAELMRAILHHTDFQSLEAAWRATHFLISRTETGEGLKLYVLDLTREELSEGLRAGAGAPDVGELFAGRSGDAHDDGPWALLVGNYTFDRTPEDAELLKLIAAVARRARAPFVAGASTRAAGLEPFFAESSDELQLDDDAGAAAPEEWDSLRRVPEARYLGLSAPRFLLRLPYGAETDAAEQFDFEEMGAGGEPRHEEYLWGNPAFACAQLLAEAFARAGWDMRAGDVKEVEGLPLHVHEVQGETRIKPCAEVLLTERAAGEMLERGVMPLLSLKNGDHVRLARFQSLAEPASPLAGRWS
jgi:type VI secretion system protein ImpC